jgi:hypothetical protein
MLSAYQGFNLIAVDGQCCGIPQAVGPVDPVAQRRRGNAQVIWAGDEATLRGGMGVEKLR